MWVRPSFGFFWLLLALFQFTHPCGCDGRQIQRTERSAGFNSRTRVGATGRGCEPFRVYRVSIHAPVWVRLRHRFNVSFLVKFQFTHPCGCDSFSTPSKYPLVGFNSRTRVGATVPCSLKPPWMKVSIHAPVWVRQVCQRGLNVPWEFQFTHPCGCDHLQFQYLSE